METKTAYALLSTAFVLTAVLLANQAQATPWTFTTTGTIGQGTDHTGTFFSGVLNDNLAGLTFTMTTTIDPTLQTGPFTDNVGFNYTQGSNAIPYSETVTINNITKTFSALTTESVSVLNIQGQVYGGGPYVTNVLQNEGGNTSDGSSLSGEQSVRGSGDFGLGLNFDQTWSYTPQITDFQYTQFDLAGPDGNVSFVTRGGAYYSPIGGTITNISINAPRTTVPEPSSIALFGAALLGLIAARHRARYSSGTVTKAVLGLPKSPWLHL